VRDRAKRPTRWRSCWNAKTSPGQVLASDADPAAVKYARDARYTKAQILDTEDIDLVRWITRDGPGFQPVRAVRQRVMFSVATLGVDTPPLRCDVVFARNMWRHMTPRKQELAAAQLADTLRPGGLLVVGGADLLDAQLRDTTPPALTEHFRQSAAHDCIWHTR